MENRPAITEPEKNDFSPGLPLLGIGIGGYLLGLELVRLLNFFCAELSPITSLIYFLLCAFCSALITIGIITTTKIHRWLSILGALLIGTICFCFCGIALIYSAYFIPYTQNSRFQTTDWLLAGTICFSGMFLVVWGCRDLAKRKSS